MRASVSAVGHRTSMVRKYATRRGLALRNFDIFVIRLHSTRVYIRHC